MFWIIGMSIFFIILVVFIFFREFIPSVAIISAALIDVVFALGAMAVFGIPLSLSSIPSLLMILGYSIDTDIILTTRVLKRKEGSTADRTQSSMGTGLTMTFTAIAALGVMLVLAYFYQISVIFEISAVLLFGLFADIPATWLMNAPILLWYADSKEKGGK
jgi:preprotein translocase subunit SecF